MIDRIIELPRRDQEHVRSIDAPREEHESLLRWFGRHKKATAIAMLTIVAGGLAVSPQARAWALSALSALGKETWRVVSPWLRSVGRFLYELLPGHTRLTIEQFLAALHVGGKALKSTEIAGKGVAKGAETAVRAGEKGVKTIGSFLGGVWDGVKSTAGFGSKVPTFADIASDAAGSAATGAAKAVAPAESDASVLETMLRRALQEGQTLWQSWREQPSQ